MAKQKGSAFELGLDEAGRGPMLGPLVMAAVALCADTAQALKALGVTDSKHFGAGEKAHEKRRALVAEIVAVASFVEVVVVDVAEIDAAVRKGQLNHLERQVAAGLIARAPHCETIYADGKRLFEPLQKQFPQLRAEDKADSAFVSVAAASLCAKVRRDDLWFAICERYRPEFPSELTGLAGGGYVNPATRRFLRAFVSKYHRLPDETRRSWPRDFLADLLPDENPQVSGPPLLLPWG